MANPGLTHNLLAWYDHHRRVLPWRALPGAVADPYRVWVSEIMLQQTTVAAVIGYFNAFMARWPTLEALAAAPLDDILRQWAGLGYYARARNLHRAAQTIMAEHGGQFPDTLGGLRSLPGIGVYTAGAIAAIAYNRQAAAVDGNVERVISRAFAIQTPLPAAKPLIAAQALALVPADRPGDFAQALMDLGATVCTPRSPSCVLCPWRSSCQGLKQGIAGELPRKSPRPARPTRHGVVFWVERADGAVLVRTRAPSGLLGGMTEFPSTPWQETPVARPLDFAPLEASFTDSGARVVHVFTHFRLELAVWKARIAMEPAPPGTRFVARKNLGSEALPGLMRKVIRAAEK